MWRYLLIAIGACFALMSTGMARNWVQIDNAATPLVLALACWAVAVIGWKPHLALFSLGVALIAGGAVLFFVMPLVVNNGSGQDAVALFATAGGFISGLLGFCLLVLGVAFRRITKQNS